MMGGGMRASEDSAARILAIDYGQKRVGVAISDALGFLAVGLETLEGLNKQALLERLKALCLEHGVTQVVLGLPRTMDGREGPQAEKVRRFGDALVAALGLPLTYLDERLTTVLAHQALHAGGKAPSRNKALVDQEAARRLLQDYLDSRARD